MKKKKKMMITLKKNRKKYNKENIIKIRENVKI